MEILAKQLVKVRNQKAQSIQASGHIQGLATQNTMMASNVRMANAMEVRRIVVRSIHSDHSLHRFFSQQRKRCRK